MAGRKVKKAIGLCHLEVTESGGDEGQGHLCKVTPSYGL